MHHLILLALAQATPAAVPPATPVLEAEEAGRLMVEGLDKQAQTARRLKGQSHDQLAAALAEALNGRTKLIYQAGHGVYVEYTAPDGQLRMWYPGNREVVKGSWGVRKMGGRTRACFRYRAAVNPVTGVFEPTECVAAAQTLSGAGVIEAWSGDAFGLMADRIPYSKGKMDMPSPDSLPAPPQ